MTNAAGPGEKFLIRRKILQIFGAGFHVYDQQGVCIAYCHQKAFRLREDMRLYTDDSKSKELLRITTDRIIDIGATYTATTSDGTVIGSFRQSGLKSAFLRDEWTVYDAEGSQAATLIEESATKAFFRRYVDLVSLLFPQRYILKALDGREIGHMRQNFNPFVYKLGIAFPDPDDVLDDLLILALGCVVSAIEGRQDSA